MSGIRLLTCGNTEAPLRNRTVDLLLPWRITSDLVQAYRDQNDLISWYNVA
jgi:hypothetical protein